LVLPFWYWLTRVVLDKGPLNGRVCVVVVGAKFYCLHALADGNMALSYPVFENVALMH